MKANEEQPEPKPYLTIQRISQEAIICEGEKSDQLLQSVVCPVCLMLLPMPHYSCDTCDNAFCGRCLEDWWTAHPKTCIFKCPNPNFKLIKRSNTYNALMEILKTKCIHCSAVIAIVQLEPHDKVCPSKPIACRVEGCEKVLPRAQMELHEKQCEFQKMECPYCKLTFRRKELQAHENLQCQAREIQCQYKQCGALIKFKQAENHRQTCLFRPETCQWCGQALLRKDKIPHEKNCPEKQTKCQWCSQVFRMGDINSHQGKCPQRKVVCELCNHQILVSEIKEHRQQCMFSTVISLRRCQDELIEENIKLKKKIHNLENDLQEAVRYNQENAFNALLRIKEEERHQYERDLQRLNNGITNIQKLRTAQLNEHLKKPHISSSLCPFCITIRNKLEEDLAPLVRQKEEVNAKLKEVERLHEVTVTSKVKMSKLRE